GGLGGVVDGGGGRDLIDFSAVANAPVVGDLATGQFTAGNGACTLRRVEKVIGSALDDDIRGDGRRNARWGGVGDDTLAGEPGADRLLGGPGDDRLLGGSGNDLLRGGPGADEVDGQGQADRLYGDAGADLLRGGPGNDLLYGDGRDLSLDGGGGEDLCSLGGAAPSAC
ncbi:MAG TPA: calcium-binding protein, partial [Acidimicrobiia bacterium]|nr:calcium-binding protein [Acidimicrobiia bacterium]